jgi:hypothetical protein
MEKAWRILLVLMIGVWFGLVGCRGSSPEPTSEPAKKTQIVPTPINDPSDVARLVEQLESEESALDVDDSEDVTPNDEVEDREPAAQENYCLDCHMDKEALVNTASVEEEVVSENEGEG